MNYPFIDVSELDDDELIQRIERCRRVVSGEMAMGHAGIVQSAMRQLEMYEFEWQERMQVKSRKDFLEKHPSANETVEFGVVEEINTLEETEKKNKES